MLYLAQWNYNMFKLNTNAPQSAAAAGLLTVKKPKWPPPSRDAVGDVFSSSEPATIPNGSKYAVSSAALAQPLEVA